MPTTNYATMAREVLVAASDELNKTKPELAKELSRLAKDFETPTWLTSKGAAEILGVSSPTTVKNWLEGGCFPGARKTPGGHYRFLLADVLALKRRMEAEARSLEVPDLGDDGPELPLV